MLASQRHLFDLPNDITYLNCAYMAPQLRSVTHAGVESVKAKARPWQIGADEFFAPSERARRLFAQLLGATADDIAFIPAVSYGIAIATATLRMGSGQRVVVLSEQFPSNVYPWRQLANDVGGEVFTIPRPSDGDWTPHVCDAITTRTAIVALPHCHWTDGSLLDLAAISTRCQQTGSALVLDVTQSLGVLPLDMKTIQPDFVVCAGYKWLMGPYSLGYLYVAPKHQQGLPLEHGWINRKDSQKFAELVDYRDDFQPGARRYDVGERSNFVLVPMAIAALEQLLAWTREEVRATAKVLTDDIAERSQEIGWKVAPAHLRSPHMIGLRSPSGLRSDLLAALGRHNVFVSVRGDSIRVSPHVYNTQEDIERLITTLKTEAPVSGNHG